MNLVVPSNSMILVGTAPFKIPNRKYSGETDKIILVIILIIPVSLRKLMYKIGQTQSI